MHARHSRFHLSTVEKWQTSNNLLHFSSRDLQTQEQVHSLGNSITQKEQQTPKAAQQPNNRMLHDFVKKYALTYDTSHIA